MKQFVHIFISFLALSLLSCTRPSTTQFVIGVSQCSDDEWRRNMNSEMDRELIFHPELSLRFRHAQDNSQLQCAQIDSFIAEGVDLLVICPNEAEEVKPAVSRAYDAGIPVIISDRHVTGEKYTAFVGGDNYQVGRLLADYVSSLAADLSLTAGKQIRVLEILGLPHSSPAELRHKGFVDGIRQQPAITIVSQVYADWFQDKARLLVDSVLTVNPAIDVIVAQNDVMALGAHEVVRKRVYDRHVYIIGVDAIAGPNGGVAAILDGYLDASATYPSRGDIVIQTAAAILTHQPYQRETELQTVLVDKDVARTMQQMAERTNHEVDAIRMLEQKVGNLNSRWQSQRTATFSLIAFIVLLISCLIVLYRVDRYRKRVHKEREENARLVAQQKEQLDTMRAELNRIKVNKSQDELFVERLQKEMDAHIDDSEWSIEDLSGVLGMSRTQLFRKTKQLMGYAPLDLIRHMRLSKAQQLLQQTDDTIQQIAYATGFATPSYFAKCYKVEFGHTPNEENRKK